MTPTTTQSVTSAERRTIRQKLDRSSMKPPELHGDGGTVRPALRHVATAPQCCSATRRCYSHFCGATVETQHYNNKAAALGAATATQRYSATRYVRVAPALWRCSATRRLTTNVFPIHARKRETESKGELLNLVWSCSFKLVCSRSISGLLVGRDIRI
jgi:hypothetical protein